MSELQEMQSRLAQLEKETLELRETLALKSKRGAQTMWQRCGFGLAVIGVGVALMTHKGNTQATTQPVIQTIACRYLKVVDAKGNTVLTLSSTKDREGHLAVYNSTTKKIVTLSATTDTGEGGIWIADRNGTNTASIRSQGGKGLIWTQK